MRDTAQNVDQHAFAHPAVSAQALAPRPPDCSAAAAAGRFKTDTRGPATRCCAASATSMKVPRGAFQQQVVEALGPRHLNLGLGTARVRKLLARRSGMRWRARRPATSAPGPLGPVGPRAAVSPEDYKRLRRALALDCDDNGARTITTRATCPSATTIPSTIGPRGVCCRAGCRVACAAAGRGRRAGGDHERIKEPRRDGARRGA